MASLAALLCAIAISILPCQCAEPGELGCDLEQKSLLVGNVSVRICSKAIQVTDKGSNLIYVSRAPDWKLQIFNPREQTYFETSTATFSGTMTRGLTLFTGRMLTDAIYEPGSAKTQDGLLLYKTSAEYTRRSEENRKNVSKSNGYPKTIELWINPAISAPPQAVLLLTRLYGVATPKGMPVRVRYYDFDNQEKVFLKTSSTVKKTLTDADFIKRTAKWKLVTSLSEVLRSKEQDEAVGEMLGGFDDSLKARKH